MSDAEVSSLATSLPPARHLTTATDMQTAPVAFSQAPLPVRSRSPDRPQISGLGLDIHNQARQLVRLIQCPLCSRPLSKPVTLPCGRSLCQTCLPVSSTRERLIYPDIPSRREVLTCYDPTCGQIHNLADCPRDVALKNVVGAIAAVMAERNATVKTGALVDLYPMTGPSNVKTGSSLGRLTDAYNLASLGLLRYGVNIVYEHDTSLAPHDDIPLLHITETSTDQTVDTDASVLQELFESTYKELDCQICYNVYLQPITTPCGHTFCRSCLRESLSHSATCAACRQSLRLPYTLRSVASNKSLEGFLLALSPKTMANRARQVESQSGPPDTDTYETPLFVVGNAFPGTPMFLRVFEQRYRLMLRRVLAGDMSFGMVAHNWTRADGMPFMAYGTRMRIRNAQQLEDGTSMVEATGVERFRIRDYSILDNYYVGTVEDVEDVPLAEEERLEIEEISQPADDGISNAPTLQLLARCLAFVNLMREKSQHWLNAQLLMIHGPPPNDAAVFPYWLAAVLPIDERMTYQLLATNSVRQRLKIVTGWIARLEAQNLPRPTPRTVL